MLLSLITPPTLLPVTIAEIKGDRRVKEADDDTRITGLIGAVVDYLDGPSGILGRAIMAQVWRLELAGWPALAIALPIEPVSSVAITYFDVDGAEQTLPETAYRVDHTSGTASVLHMTGGSGLPVLEPGRAYPVRIAITAGASDADNASRGLKALITMLVGHWYDNSDAVVVGAGAVEMPLAISTLLARYRKKL